MKSQKTKIEERTKLKWRINNCVTLRKTLRDFAVKLEYEFRGMMYERVDKMEKGKSKRRKSKKELN
ncbi:MAG: hypothetical protein GC181_14310 [Bacteroidetes bacterium]|nr:hypothetical protein [Bacteroidota bacterium]